MRSIRFGAAVVTVVALLVVAGCSNQDVVTSSYSTLDEARAAGAIGPDRMPDKLPSGSHDLREARDLDTRRRWGLFSFPANQKDQLTALLDGQEISLAGQSCDIPARIEWWPVVLRASLDDEKIRATGLHAYHSANGELIVAVNWNQGRAYYWTPGK